MVKGISRQVVVVRALDTNLFEQAIFLVRDGALPRQGVTEDDIIKEATAAAEACLPQRRRQIAAAFWPRILWSCGGACCTGILWALTLLF